MQWLEESLAGCGTAGHRVFVAEVDGDVVGVVTAHAGRHFSGQEQCTIGELAVAAGLERRGIGARLVAEAERWAVDAGLSVLTLETGAANDGARRFYAALGFAEEQVQLTKLLTL